MASARLRIPHQRGWLTSLNWSEVERISGYLHSRMLAIGGRGTMGLGGSNMNEVSFCARPHRNVHSILRVGGRWILWNMGEKKEKRDRNESTSTIALLLLLLLFFFSWLIMLPIFKFLFI